MMNMDGIKRKGKLLMGSSDLSFVIYEQKCLHEAQAKVLPCFSKVATALLKWSYTESNASIPNLFSCWSDLDHAYQMLLQQSIDNGVVYRKVFKDINAEGKKLNEIQKEKETSAKRVSALKKQIENLRKSKKQADKVKLSSLEAEFVLAQGKDSETGKLFITKTKEFEENKSAMLRDCSVAYCNKALEALDKLRQVLEAKREVASMMTPAPVYNGDRILKDGMTTVDEVFRSLQLQPPPRDPTLDRTRCFTLGTRSSIATASPPEGRPSHSQHPASPKPVKPTPRGSPPSVPSNLPPMKPGQTSTLGSASSSAVYQGGELMASDEYESDSDHEYQDPTVIGRKQEDLYLAPERPEVPPVVGPRLPPRTESLLKGASDSTAGTSETPGDYGVVEEDVDDLDEPRMPPSSKNFRNPSDLSNITNTNSMASSGVGKAHAVKLPRVLPSGGSLDAGAPEDVGRHEAGKSPVTRDRENHHDLAEKEAAMLKRKPAPLPKPDRPEPIKPKPRLKPKPGASPGPVSREKPTPLPRSGSNEHDIPAEDPGDSGDIYEVMASADSAKSGRNVPSTSDPQEARDIHYLDVFERDNDDDSEGDYCVADFHNFNPDNYVNNRAARLDLESAGGVTAPSTGVNNNNSVSPRVSQQDDSSSEDDEAIYCNLPS